MTNWRPIETAPKDGAEILGYRESEDDQLVCYWHHDLGRFVETVEHHFGRFTHWQPLPEPPESEQ